MVPNAAIAALLISAPSQFSPSPLSLGVNAGDPTGVTAALTLSDRLRLQAVGGRSFTDSEYSGAIDLMLAFPDFFNEGSDPTRVVFWFGLGARLATAPEDDGVVADSSAFGVRLPFVVSLFSIGGGELYVEVAPVYMVEPSERISIEGGLGIRVDLIGTGTGTGTGPGS